MKKTQLILIGLIVSALALSACGASPVPSGGGAPAPSSGNSGDTGIIATQAPAQPQPNRGNTGQGGDALNLANVDEGLAALNSYKTTFTMSFDGTENGQAKKWDWTTEEEFSKDPLAKHTKITSSGTGTEQSGSNTVIESFEVNGKTYSKFGDVCAASESTGAPTAGASFTPASVIGDIRGSQALGIDTINGIPARHYQGDLAGLATAGLYTNAKSEVWVAEPGGYVVKYTFEASGKDAFFGGSSSNAEGTIRWAYEVDNVNQPVNIAAPENCGGAGADLPMMDDASSVSSFGTITSYTTASTLKDVVDFYKAQLPAAGWTESPETGLSAEGFASLGFTKDKQKLSITITADSGRNETNVLLSLEEQE